MGKIHVIGVGIQGEASLLPQARQAIEEAEVLVGGERLLAAFAHAKAERVLLKGDLVELLEQVKAWRRERRVVILASGDPLFYGIADMVLRKIPAEEVEVFPNVSSMQWAFARAKESWQDAALLSAHGRGMQGLIEAIRRSTKAGIFTDPVHTPAVIAQEMCRCGLTDYRAMVCEDLGTETERITWTTVSSLASRGFSPLNVLILLKEGPLPPKDAEAGSSPSTTSAPYTFGIPEEAFEHRAGMITKEEVRVLSLSKLRLRKESILWDVGAGCGSVSIEAAFLAPQGVVYAVERESPQAALIRRNVQRFGLPNVRVIQGSAPEILAVLPSPDAIFVGGSGGKLPEILEECLRRLKPGGTLVVNAVTWDSLTRTSAFFTAKGLNWDAVAVNVSRTREVREKKLFEALHPIHILFCQLPRG